MEKHRQSVRRMFGERKKWEAGENCMKNFKSVLFTKNYGDKIEEHDDISGTRSMHERDEE
jgi:hypothetical protein